MHLTEIWLIALAVFIVLEAVTYQLVSIWFAAGAAGALAALGMGFGFNVQMAVFLIISVILIIALRPVSMKLLKHKDIKTNADSLAGQKVYITEAVNNAKGEGKGKINGMFWTVRSADGTEIAEGKSAVVEKIEGVKLIVKVIGEENEL